MSVCQDQSEHLLLINHEVRPVICCRNANQSVLLWLKWKNIVLRLSEVSPSYFWEELTNHSQSFTQMEENKLICAILSVWVEFDAVSREWADVPCMTQRAEHSRGACAALPAPAVDSRSPWLATGEFMKDRKELTSGWGYFFPGDWSVHSGLKNREEWSYWCRVCSGRHLVSRTRSCAYFNVFMLVFILI